MASTSMPLDFTKRQRVQIETPLIAFLSLGQGKKPKR